jgi:hypothetical protein
MTNKIPNYIKEIWARTVPCSCEGVTYWVGYTYRIRGKYPYGRNMTLIEDAEKFCKWAKKNHAESFIIEDSIKINEDGTNSIDFNKRGYINSVRIVVSDPVAYTLEKLNTI